MDSSLFNSFKSFCPFYCLHLLSASNSSYVTLSFVFYCCDSLYLCCFYVILLIHIDMLWFAFLLLLLVLPVKWIYTWSLIHYSFKCGRLPWSPVTQLNPKNIYLCFTRSIRDLTLMPISCLSCKSLQQSSSFIWNSWHEGLSPVYEQIISNLIDSLASLFSPLPRPPSSSSPRLSPPWLMYILSSSAMFLRWALFSSSSLL